MIEPVSVDARQALHDEARDEWEALGLMSYHGEADGGTYADLTRDDVEKIRELIQRLALAVPAPTDTLTEALERAFWIAAIDRVPIEERIEWVATMLARYEEVAALRDASTQEGEPG